MIPDVTHTMYHFKINSSHISLNVYHWFTQWWTTTFVTAAPPGSTDPKLYWKRSLNHNLHKTEAAKNMMYTTINVRFKAHWYNIPGSSSQEKTDNWNQAKLLTFYLLLSRATRQQTVTCTELRIKTAPCKTSLVSTMFQICWGTFNIT